MQKKMMQTWKRMQPIVGTVRRSPKLSAPFLWSRELSKALTELGFSAVPFNPGCFILLVERNQTTVL